MHLISTISFILLQTEIWSKSITVESAGADAATDYHKYCSVLLLLMIVFVYGFFNYKERGDYYRRKVMSSANVTYEHKKVARYSTAFSFLGLAVICLCFWLGVDGPSVIIEFIKHHL